MDISNDILLEIVFHLDSVSIVRFLSCSKRFWEISRRPSVIDRLSVYKDIIIYQNWNRGLHLSVCELDFPHISYFLSKGADNLDAALATAYYRGNRYLIAYFYEIGAQNSPLAYQEAARGGHMDLVESLLPHTLPSSFLVGASLEGHIDMVNYLIHKNPSHDNVESLSYAAVNGHKTILDMIPESAVGWIFDNAVLGGQLELAKYYWEKSDQSSSRLNSALLTAARKGHQAVVEWITELGATKFFQAVQCAARGGHYDTACYLINKYGMPTQPHPWNDALQAACQGGNLELVKMFIDRGATVMDKMILIAIPDNHRLIIEFLLQHSQFNQWQYKLWNAALVEASKYGHRALVEMFIKKGATDLADALIRAVQGGYVNLVTFLVEQGAQNILPAFEEATTRKRTVIAEYLRAKLKQRKAEEMSLRANKIPRTEL